MYAIRCRLEGVPQDSMEQMRDIFSELKYRSLLFPLGLPDTDNLNVHVTLSFLNFCSKELHFCNMVMLFNCPNVQIIGFSSKLFTAHQSANKKVVL